MKIKEIKNSGYVAISTVLVVGAVLLAIGVAVVFNGINSAQTTEADHQGEITLAVVNACARDGLIRLSKNNAVPGLITIPQGSCAVTINSQVGNVWDMSFIGTVSGFTKNIRVNVTRTTNVAVNSWIQI